MSDCMNFPDTVEEFMECYKITDTEQIYTNGAELVPVFRMKQWFEHEPERKKGYWLFEEYPDGYYHSECSVCGEHFDDAAYLTPYKFCPLCGAEMSE